MSLAGAGFTHGGPGDHPAASTAEDAANGPRLWRLKGVESPWGGLGGLPSLSRGDEVQVLGEGGHGRGCGGLGRIRFRGPVADAAPPRHPFRPPLVLGKVSALFGECYVRSGRERVRIAQRGEAEELCSTLRQWLRLVPSGSGR